MLERRRFERRAVGRIQAHISGIGFFSLFERGPREPVLAIDISENGTQLVVSRPLERHSDLFVILHPDDGRWFRIRGRVAWVARVPVRDRRVTLFHAGVQFHDPSATVQEQIRDYIEQIQLGNRLRRMPIHFARQLKVS